MAPTGAGAATCGWPCGGGPRRDGDSRGRPPTVTSEVVNFYPLIAGWGWFARIGRFIYNQTQLRIHVIVTHAFLRSLANLDLEPSRGRAPAAAQALAQRSRAASPGRGER